MNLWEARINTGDLVADRYHIMQLIGRGGMGEVFLASDQLLKIPEVALKVLHQDLCEDQDHVRRFLREIQLTRMVTHPCVVRTFECGQERNQLYYSMEYVAGQPLDKLLRSGALSIPVGVKYLYEICQGMEEIHQAGIVHRDIKPSNVIISTEDQVKITDFGIARPASSDLTKSSEIIGSGAYLAPELWHGKDVSPKADIYALGVLAYQFLSGRLPFEAQSPAQMMMLHLAEDPPEKPLREAGVPEWLKILLNKMLEKEPQKRPSSMLQIMEIIEEQLAGDTSFIFSEASQRRRKSSSVVLSSVLEHYNGNSPHSPRSSARDTVSYRSPTKRTLFSHKYFPSFLVRNFYRLSSALLLVLLCVLLLFYGGYLPDSAAVKYSGSSGAAASIPNLLAWFRAEDLLINNGDGLVSWPSFTSSEQRAEQAIKRHQPILMTNRFSFPVVHFDGKNDYLSADWIAKALRETESLTVICAVSSSKNDLPQFLWALHEADRHLDVVRGGFFSGSRVGVLIGVERRKLTFPKPSLNSDPVPIRNFAVYSFVLQPSLAEIYQNGRLIMEERPTTSIPFAKAASFTIGQEWDHARPTDFFYGYMAELLIFSQDLTTEQRMQVERSLAQRYQIEMYQEN